MKINCDVCNKIEASVFCPADDAALCADCDHRVHHANNLASKHHRFSLLLPSPKDPALCDICQEGKAILFCQQDRAILCKDCDVAIHKVNEHKVNHNRFLLTGVKLSPVALLPIAENGVVPDQKTKSTDQEPITVKKHVAVSPAVVHQNQKINNNAFGVPKLNTSGHVSREASSISEYLIETLPGWHVEDFLDSPRIFSKVPYDEDDTTTFWDDEDLKGNMNDCFSAKTMGIWVPQAPPPAAPPPPPPPQPLLINSYQVQSFSNMGFGSQMSSRSSPFFIPSDLSKITKVNEKREYEDSNCFAVPQISPTMATSFKRARIIR